MSTKYKFRNQEQLYFVSFAVVGWIDLFIRNEYKEIMLESWRHRQANKGLEIYSCAAYSRQMGGSRKSIAIGTGRGFDVSRPEIAKK